MLISPDGVLDHQLVTMDPWTRRSPGAPRKDLLSENPGEVGRCFEGDMGQLYDFWQVAVLLFRGHCGGFGLETRFLKWAGDKGSIFRSRGYILCVYIYIIIYYYIYIYIKDHVYVSIDVLAYLATG